MSGCGELIRVVLAALFVLACTAGASGLAIFLGHGEFVAWWGAPLMVLVLFGSLLVASMLFNSRGYRPRFPSESVEEMCQRLEREGLLQVDTFTAQRAFAVEESGDEGSSYFIELESGEVLFLSGQYLYDYEPMEA